MDELKQHRAAACDDLERIVKLNAAGFVACAYNAATGLNDWFYGSARIQQTTEMEEYFKLCRGDDRIDWPSFREWLLIRRPSHNENFSEWIEQRLFDGLYPTASEISDRLAATLPYESK